MFRPSTPIPKTFTKVAKARRPSARGPRRPGRGSAGWRDWEDETLKDGLEDEPLADKAGCGRHRREAHRREKRADAEQPVAPRARSVDDARSFPCARSNPSAARNSEPLASAWPARCSSATVQARPARSGQAVAAKHQCGAEGGDGDRRVLGRGKAEQRAPIVLLKGVESGQDRAQHRHDDDEIAGTGNGTARRRRQPVRAGRGDKPKNAAFKTTPERNAPDAPLPAP